MDNQDESAKREAIQRLLIRAYFYMRFRLRTEKELRTYLEGKAAQYRNNSSIVDEAIKELKELGYIDDRRFTESYILSHQNAKQKGKFLMRNELLQKGVSERIVDSYLEENPLDEETLARQALQKRWPRYAQLDKIKRFKKAHDFLRRNGFSYDVVKKTIEEMEEKR